MRLATLFPASLVVLLRVLLPALLPVLLLPAPGALAHDARPVLVQLEETRAGTVALTLRVPASLPAAGLPRLTLPDGCQTGVPPAYRSAGDAYEALATYRCSASIAGRELALRYPGSNPGLGTFFRVSFPSGEAHTRVLGPEHSRWTVPEKESLSGVAGQYTWLGMTHIFAGIDHLLFVACLVFVARSFRRILVTVTGFTVAHSLTLALATLDLVRLDVPTVEAVIALSILFLAHEVAVGDRRSWTWRFPVLVAVSFGLLHGFGFAAVLRDIGLPQTELPAALLFFNLGVELGQILFIALIAAVSILAARLLRTAPRDLLAARRTALAGSYLVGTVASFWFFERLAAL